MKRSIFSYLFSVCVSCWEKCLFRSLDHFFNWIVCFVLSCMTSLHILDINPLMELLFANISSHLVGCLFVFLSVSFAVQKLFSLIQSHSFIFTFTSLAFGVKFIKIFSKSKKVHKFSTYVFFYVIYCIRSSCWSLIHFESVFVHGEELSYSFVLLHVAFSQAFAFIPTISRWDGD